MAEARVLFSRRGNVGEIVLNRPRAINALDHSMATAILATLREWARDDAVHAVVLTGSGERGLCAGGDIVGIHADAKAAVEQSISRIDCAQLPSGRFWRDEYILNEYISRYRKPYIAVMDGIVMGGGVGLSAHGSHRIVTERSMVAMPETGIGFIPDVGGTYLLSRAPGEVGTHLGLTTARMGAGDAIAAGFADYFVPSERIPELLAALPGADAETVIARLAEPAPESELMAQRGWIDTCYSADTVEEIVARLQRYDAPEAAKAAAEIVAKSPVALKVTLRSLREARGVLELARVLDTEYRVSVAALTTHDLVEGIRAQVVDKDRNPQWSPATLDAVPEALVDSYFVELGDRELGLGDRN